MGATAWFDETDEKKLGESAQNVCDRLRRNQGWRKEDALRRYSTYFGHKIDSLKDLDTGNLWRCGLDEWGMPDQDDSYSRDAIDTIVSRIGARTRPLPMVLTQGADYKTRIQARKRTKFLQGQFHEPQGAYPTIYDLGLQLFWDANVTDGACRISANFALKKVEVERVFIWDIYFDEEDAKTGYPSQLYHRRIADRSVLAAEYPEHEHAIMMAEECTDTDHSYLGGEKRCVEYWECYVKAHGDQQGRKIKVINTTVLCDEPWEHDGFPYVFLFFNRCPIGVRGMPPIDSARLPQIRGNQIYRWCMQNLTAVAGGWITRQKNDGISEAQITSNKTMKILEYNAGAMPPQVHTPAPFHPQQWEMYLDCKSRVNAIFGVSDLAISGEVAPGLNSGIAVRNVNQVHDMRFLSPARSLEQAYIDIGMWMLRCVNDLRKEGIKPSSFLPSTGGFIEKIEWDSIDLGEKSLYTVQLQAGSDNAQTYAAKVQFLEELRAKGDIDAATQRRLTPNPDLESYDNRINAQWNWIERIICDIYDEDGDGEYEPPDELMDLVSAAMQMTDAYLECSSWPDAPEAVRRQMRRWIEDTVEIMNRGTEAPPEAPPAGGPVAPPPIPPMGSPAGPNLGMN